MSNDTIENSEQKPTVALRNIIKFAQTQMIELVADATEELNAIEGTSIEEKDDNPIGFSHTAKDDSE